MKHILAIFSCLLLFASCKKEIAPSFSTDDYIQKVRVSLKDSISATDFAALDFSRSVLSKVDSVNLYVLRIPFKDKKLQNDFVVLKTTRDGAIEHGKIVHQEGGATNTDMTGQKKKSYNGSISISSLDRKPVLNSSIVDGYITAYHQGAASRTTTQVVEGLMPEVIITYVISSGNDFSWSFWMNLQSFFYDGGGGAGGSYYGSMDGGGPTGGGGSTGSGNPPSGGGAYLEPPILIDVETMDENPAIDIQKYLNCFNAIPDDGATCSIEIMTDIPVDSNPNAVYDIDARSPGHTFLSISKSNGTQHVTQNIGFYPKSGYKSITYAPVASKMVDNAGHEFNASLRMTLTPERLKTALQAVLLYKDHNYDVDEYNCTDFALDVLNSVRGLGLSIPKYGIPGSPLTQATRTPGGLYNKLKEMVNSNDPEKANITIGIIKGYAGGSHGPCN